MKKLLDNKLDIEYFLKTYNIKREKLEALGIPVESIATTKDVTDVMIILKSLEGERGAKSYIDEQYAKEQALEAMNTADR